ncbi:hypothetical protein K474DRAFT_1706876 [Panus rudis PR-1116 ss-1]|nr:hypothetical protein K474DRAFT_1706876 [Panus rudis PR-1116 ss-1]
MSSTLEVMHFVDPDYIFSNSSGEARIFGKLQCLLTGHTPLAEFDTRRLTRMFPKIRYLSLGGSLQDIVHYHEIDPALNSRLQTLHSNNIRHRFPHLWRSLDTVRCGDVGVLYALGLTCPIRHIELDEPLGGCHSQLAMWTTALRDCEASAISVTVNSTSYDLSRTLFPIPPNQPLTHLNLAIKIESGVSMDTIMENLIRLGKSFPLEYLSIAISLKLGRIIKLQNGKEVKVFKDTACSLAKMQTIDVARIFAEAVHTLRYFAFTRAIDGEHNGFHDSDLSPGDSGCVSDSTLWSIGEHGRDNLGHVVLVEEVPLEARYDVLRGERMLGLKSLHWARAGKGDVIHHYLLQFNRAETRRTATPYAD